MWKHVVGIFGHDATNVKFVWSPLNAGKAKALYPGNRWVDYVGFTTFNWAANKKRSWKVLAQPARRVRNRTA